MKPKPPSNGLSTRVNRCLSSAGIPAEKEAVLRALKTGALYPYFRPALYGKKFGAGRGSMNRSWRRPSPKTRRPSPSTTGCPTGRIVFLSGLAFRPINQPFCARSRPGFCAPEYVRSTTESKPMPSFAAGRVLTNTTWPDAEINSTPEKTHDKSARSRPAKTQRPRF